MKAGKKGARRAALEYHKLASAETEHGTLSLLRVKLFTGRTHQVRVQLANAGYPLLGDRKYGGLSADCRAVLFSHRITVAALGITLEADPSGDAWGFFG